MLLASAEEPERFPREVMLKVGFKGAEGHREVEHSENVIQRRVVTKAWRLVNSEPSWGTDRVQHSWCVIQLHLVFILLTHVVLFLLHHGLGCSGTDQTMETRTQGLMSCDIAGVPWRQ